MMNKKLFITILILVILIVLVVVFGMQKQKKESVKIGGLFGLTGFASFAGEASRNGFIMAIEDSDIEVDYVIEDFESDLAKVATAAHKLIDVDKVDVVIGPEWNEFAEVVAPIAAVNKMLFISPWMTGEGDVFSSGYYFSATASERLETQKLLDYIVSQSIKEIAVIYTNNAWSVDYVRVLEEEAEKRSLVIKKKLMVNQSETDFRTEIVKIKEVDPDAIYVVMATDNTQGLLSKQLKEQGIFYQVFVPFSRAESDVVLDNFGEYVNGIIYPAPKKNKNAEAFREKYQNRFGKEPTAISAATAYDMTILVLQAIKQGAKNTEDIRNFLLQVENYDGYSNLITFSKEGRVASEEVIIKQISGKNPKILVE